MAQLQSTSITGSLIVTGGITGSFSGSIVSPGSTTQVLYNNGGVVAGSSGFVYSGSNVGIGTTSPASLLHVSGSTLINGPLTVSGSPTNLQYTIINNDLDVLNGEIETTNYGTYSRLRLFRASGTQASPTIPSSGTTVGRLEFGAYNSATATFIANAKVEATMDAATGPNDLPSRLAFFTTPDGSVTMAEIMRLDSAGRMRIGGITMTMSDVINVQNGSVAFDNGYGLKFINSTGTRYATIYSNNNNVVIKSLGTGVLIKNLAGSSDLVAVLDSGNVGIGTTTPSTKLTVAGSDDTAGIGVIEIQTAGGTNLKLGGDTSYSWIQSHASRPLYINQLGNNVIFNSGGGNVGIGTTSPSYKLSVTTSGLLGFSLNTNS